MKKHILRHDELLEVKALKLRRRVSTGDAAMLSAIYQRMNPNYNLCETCIETLAAEAKSLIAYAEKQIGGPIVDYSEDSKEFIDIENVPEIEFKEVQIEREHFGRQATLTVKIPKDTPEGVTLEITEDMIVNVEYKAEGLPDAKAPGIQGPAKAKKTVDKIVDGVATGDFLTKVDAKTFDRKSPVTDVKDMTNPQIVAYVLEKTDIELSPEADRDELIASAVDLLAALGDEAPVVQEVKAAKVTKVKLHKNGLNSTKGEVIYAYVKQEKGIELQPDLKRPLLVKAAAEALGSAK